MFKLKGSSEPGSQIDALQDETTFIAKFFTMWILSFPTIFANIFFTNLYKKYFPFSKYKNWVMFVNQAQKI
jgi:hypothetical protein